MSLSNKIEFGAFIFILISLFFSRTPFVSDIVKTAMATITFYLFPFIVGWVVISILERVLHIKSFGFTPRFVLSPFIGLLVLFTSFVATVNLPVWSVLSFTSAWLLIVAVHITLNIVKPEPQHNESGSRHFYKPSLVITVIVASISGGLLSLAMVITHLPFPMVYDPGTTSYILQSLQLSQGESLEFFVTLHRLPMVSLMGIISNLYSIHPVFLNFTVAKIFCFILAGGTFLLTRKLVLSNGIAFTSSFLAPIMASVVLPTDATPPGLLVAIYPIALLAITQVTGLPSIEEIKTSRLLLLVIIGFLYPIVVLLQAILVPNHLVARSILFLTLAIILISLYLTKKETAKILVLTYSSIIVVLTYLHIENSILYGAFLSLYLLLRVIWFKRRQVVVKLVALMTVFVYLLIALQLSGLLVFPSNFCFSSILWGNLYETSWFNMNAFQKLSWLASVYGYAIISIMLLSLLLILVDSQSAISPIIALCASAFFLLFLPEGHFWRAHLILETIGAILVPYFLSCLLKIFKVNLSDDGKRVVQKIKNLINIFRLQFLFNNFNMDTAIKSSVVFLIVILLLIPTPLTNKTLFVSSTINYVNKHGVFSYMSQNDVFAAISLWKNAPKQWVKYDYLTNLPCNVPYYSITLHAPKLTYVKHIPKTNDTLLISDPYTMFVIGGITGLNTALIERSFIIDTEYSREALDRMDFVKNNIFLARNPLEAYNNIISIKDSHNEIFLIITERTVAWMNSNDRFTVSADPLPADLFRSYLSIFADKKLFIPIYYADNVVIYKVNLDILDEVYVPTLTYLMGREPINSTGLIGWWRLDEGEGSSIVDSSGNGHNGINLGVQWVFDEWLNRSFLTFNEGSRVCLGSFNVTEFTIEAWIYVNSSSNRYARIVSKSDEYLHGVILQITPLGYLEVGFRSPDLTNNYLYSASKIPLKKWIHIAATYELEKGFKIYINGHLDNEGLKEGNLSSVPVQNNMNWFLGYGAGEYGFDGSLAMVRIYNRALSTDEVLYNSGVMELYPFKTDLIVVCKDIFGLSVPSCYVEASPTDQLPVASYTDGSGVASLEIIQPSRTYNVTITIDTLVERKSFNVAYHGSTNILNITITLSPLLTGLLLTIFLIGVIFFVFRRRRRVKINTLCSVRNAKVHAYKN